MVPKKDRPPPGKQPGPAPSPRKRFRIEKVEERIAPGGHYNAQSKWVGDGNGADSSASSGMPTGGSTSFF